jgi:hypothetical protein
MTTPRAVVQPHIAWFKDQKDYRSKKAPQGTLALRQGNAMVQKGVDATLLPVSRLFFFFSAVSSAVSSVASCLL